VGTDKRSFSAVVSIEHCVDLPHRSMPSKQKTITSSH
jgi:hypothetical protein